MPPAQRRFAQVRVAAEVTPPPPAAPPRTTPMPAAGTNAASPFRRTDTTKRPRDEFALTSDDSEQGSPQGPRDECSPPGAAEPKVSEPCIEGRTPALLDGQGAPADGPATPVIECPPGYTPQRRQMQQWQGLANGVSSTVSPTTQGTRDGASARPTPVSRASARPTPPPVGLPVASPVRNKRHARLLPPALRNTTFASVQVVASPATPHPSQPSPKGRPAAPEPPAQAPAARSYPQPAAVSGAVLEPQAAVAAQPAAAGSPPSSSSDDLAADPDAQPGLDSRSASPLGVACPEASRSVGGPLPIVASDDEASGATSSRTDSQASASASGGPSSRASASRASASRASASGGSSEDRSHASSGTRVSSLSRGSRCSAATGSPSDDASTHNFESRSSSRTGDDEEDEDAARGTCEPEASASAVSLRTPPPADHRIEDRSEGETSRASSAPSDDSSSGASQPPGSSSRSCSDAGVAGAPSAENTAQSVIMASELAAARHFSWAGGSDEGAQLGVPALESPGRSAVAPPQPTLHSVPLLPSPHRGRMSAPADPSGHEGHDENDILYSSDERSDDASQAEEGGMMEEEGEEEGDEEETGDPAEDVHRHGDDAGRPSGEAGPRIQRWMPSALSLSEPLIGLSQLDPEASMSMGSRSHHPRDRSLLEGGRGAPRVFLSQADGSNSLPLSIGGGDGTFGSIPAPPPEHHQWLEQQHHAINFPTPQPGAATAVMEPADRLQVARGLDLDVGDEMPMVAATPAERVPAVVRHWTVEVMLQDLRGRTARRAVFRAAEGDTIDDLHRDVANAFRLGPLCFYVLHASGTVTPLSRKESLAVRSRVWCHAALDHGITARGPRDESFAPPPPQPVQHLMVYPAGLRRALPPVIAATVTDAVSGVAVSDEHARDLMDRSPVVLHAPLAVALDGTGLPASSGMRLTACDTGVTAPLPAPVAVLHGGAPPGSHVRWYRGRAVERAAVAATGGSRNAFDKRHVVCVVEQCRVRAGFAVADVREVGTIIVHYDVWAVDLVRIN